MKWLSIVSVFSFFSIFALADSSTASYGQPIDARVFLNSIQGNYQIERVGGATPSTLDNRANVSADVDEADFSMPFCRPGTMSCDPGYLIFSYATTKAYRQTSEGVDTVTLILQRGSRTFRYTWEERQGVITFRNFQYPAKPSGIVELDFTLRKI